MCVWTMRRIIQPTRSWILLLRTKTTEINIVQREYPIFHQILPQERFFQKLFSLSTIIIIGIREGARILCNSRNDHVHFASIPPPPCATRVIARREAEEASRPANSTKWVAQSCGQRWARVGSASSIRRVGAIHHEAANTR